VTVKKGSYSDLAFLESVLRGQDVLILTFSIAAPPEVQSNFIRAAANAGVPWVLPNEYGSDAKNKELAAAIPILGHKTEYRELVEKLGKSSWIGVATNPWIDYGLKTPYLGVQLKERKAHLLEGGNNNPVSLSTVPQLGRAVARLLSFPIETPAGGGPSLSDYKNSFIYIRSVSVSQNDLLASAQRVTKTTPADWQVTSQPVDEYINIGRELLKQGNRSGLYNVLYGSTFKKGLGDQFHGRELANEKLGLQDENLDDIVRQALEA